MQNALNRTCFYFFFWSVFACNPKQEVSEIQQLKKEEHALEVSAYNQFLLQIKAKTSIMQKAARESLNFEEFEMETERPGWEKRKVILRYDIPEQPVVLEVTEPNDAGQMTGLSIFYYQDNELFAVSQPFAHYVLENNKLKIWADEHWNEINDVSIENWLDRENDLLRQSETYLKLFDISQ